MSESGSAAPVSSPASGASAGALLRGAREQQGLHIAALAAAIKVTPRKLDALENDRWSELPDATFARALAQTVCRTLKIDPRPVLALMPAAGSTSIEPPSRTAHTPFRERSGRDAPGLAGGAIRPMLWAAALLMVAAVVVYVVPESVWHKAVPEAATPAFPESTTPTAADAAPAPASDSAAVVEAAPSTSEPASGAAAVLVAAAASQADATAGVSAAASGASAGAGVLQVRVSKPSWIQIRGADGNLLLSRDVAAGETLGFDGTPPFRLIIGNANGTQLVFRGRPVDLTPSIRGNVARLVLP